MIYFNKFFKRPRIVFISFVFFLLIASTGMAQDKDNSLSATLSVLSEDAAASYLLPIASAFGANLNAGWFHRAPEAIKYSFDLEIGFVGMGSFFPDEAKTFETTGSFKFSEAEARRLLNKAGITNPSPADIAMLTNQSSQVSMSGATIIGSSVDSMVIVINNNHPLVPGESIVLPIAGFGDLAEMSPMPLFAPQFSLGTIYGTQLTFRYLPTVKINDDLGDFKYFGFGIQHNPGIWFKKPLPVDVAASFFTQSLKIGDLFKTTTTSFGVNASYEWGHEALNLTPYAGFMLESSNMEVTYDYIITTSAGQRIQEITFELEGENKTRLILGLSIRLLLINLNADYNIGTYNSFSAGLTIRI